MPLRHTLAPLAAAAAIACAPDISISTADEHAEDAIAVALDDIRYEPSRIEVVAGEPTTLVLTNVGGIVHDLVTDDVSSGEVRPGESVRVELPPQTGTRVAWCSIPGHRAAGMELEIVAVTAG
jgi:nitrite reductase (NO-forming)